MNARIQALLVTVGLIAAGVTAVDQCLSNQLMTFPKVTGGEFGPVTLYNLAYHEISDQFVGTGKGTAGPSMIKGIIIKYQYGSTGYLEKWRRFHGGSTSLGAISFNPSGSKIVIVYNYGIGFTILNSATGAVESAVKFSAMIGSDIGLQHLVAISGDDQIYVGYNTRDSAGTDFSGTYKILKMPLNFQIPGAPTWTFASTASLNKNNRISHVVMGDSNSYLYALSYSASIKSYLITMMQVDTDPPTHIWSYSIANSKTQQDLRVWSDTTSTVLVVLTGKTDLSTKYTRIVINNEEIDTSLTASYSPKFAISLTIFDMRILSANSFYTLVQSQSQIRLHRADLSEMKYTIEILFYKDIKSWLSWSATTGGLIIGPPSSLEYILVGNSMHGFADELMQRVQRISYLYNSTIIYSSNTDRTCYQPYSSVGASTMPLVTNTTGSSVLSEAAYIQITTQDSFEVSRNYDFNLWSKYPAMDSWCATFPYTFTTSLSTSKFAYKAGVQSTWSGLIMSSRSTLCEDCSIGDGSVQYSAAVSTGAITTSPLPSQIQIDPETGSITILSNAPVGSYTINIYATFRYGANTSPLPLEQILITGTNDPPTLSGLLVTPFSRHWSDQASVKVCTAITDPESLTITQTLTFSNGTAVPNYLYYQPDTYQLTFDVSSGDYMYHLIVQSVNQWDLKLTYQDTHNPAITVPFKIVLSANQAPQFTSELVTCTFKRGIPKICPLPDNSDAEGDQVSMILYPIELTISGGFTIQLQLSLLSHRELGVYTDSALFPIGDYSTTLLLSDGYMSREYIFNLSLVSRDYLAPMFLGDLPNPVLRVGTGQSKFTIPQARDLDGDEFTVTLFTNGLQWVAFDSASSQLTVNQPTVSMIGVYQLYFTLSDEYSSADYPFTVSVWNSAPTFTSEENPSDISVRLNSRTSYTLPSTTDLEGQDVSVEYSAYPAFMSVSGMKFSLHPTDAARVLGIEHLVMGSLTDGLNMTTFQFKITIFNDPPYFSERFSTTSFNVTFKNSTYISLPAIIDREGQTCQVLISTSPQSGEEFITLEEEGKVKQRLFVEPLKYDQLGDYVVALRLSDGYSTSGPQFLNITVVMPPATEDQGYIWGNKTLKYDETEGGSDPVLNMAQGPQQNQSTTKVSKSYLGVRVTDIRRPSAMQITLALSVAPQTTQYLSSVVLWQKLVTLITSTSFSMILTDRLREPELVSFQANLDREQARIKVLVEVKIDPRTSERMVRNFSLQECQFEDFLIITTNQQIEASLNNQSLVVKRGINARIAIPSHVQTGKRFSSPQPQR